KRERRPKANEPLLDLRHPPTEPPTGGNQRISPSAITPTVYPPGQPRTRCRKEARAAIKLSFLHISLCVLGGISGVLKRLIWPAARPPTASPTTCLCPDCAARDPKQCEAAPWRSPQPLGIPPVTLVVDVGQSSFAASISLGSSALNTR